MRFSSRNTLPAARHLFARGWGSLFFAKSLNKNRQTKLHMRAPVLLPFAAKWASRVKRAFHSRRVQKRPSRKTVTPAGGKDAQPRAFNSSGNLSLKLAQTVEFRNTCLAIGKRRFAFSAVKVRQFSNPSFATKKGLEKCLIFTRMNVARGQA